MSLLCISDVVMVTRNYYYWVEKTLCPLHTPHLAAGERKSPGFHDFIPVYWGTLNICSKLHGNTDSWWDTYGSIPACRSVLFEYRDYTMCDQLLPLLSALCNKTSSKQQCPAVLLGLKMIPDSRHYTSYHNRGMWEFSYVVIGLKMTSLQSVYTVPPSYFPRLSFLLLAVLILSTLPEQDLSSLGEQVVFGPSDPHQKFPFRARKPSGFFILRVNTFHRMMQSIWCAFGLFSSVLISPVNAFHLSCHSLFH